MSFESKADENRRVKAEIEVMVCLLKSLFIKITRSNVYSNCFMQRNELIWLLETEIPRLAAVVDDLMKVNSAKCILHVIEQFFS